MEVVYVKESGSKGGLANCGSIPIFSPSLLGVPHDVPPSTSRWKFVEFVVQICAFSATRIGPGADSDGSSAAARLTQILGNFLLRPGAGQTLDGRSTGPVRHLTGTRQARSDT
ncbi:hypothetical protein Dimus_026646 [Dionaea muscipula]